MAKPRPNRVDVDPNSEPLAQALIGGLTLSVLLTIFLVPAGFYLVYRKRPEEAGI
jgi:Cu/Ag efflux pump CusA